MNSPILHQKSSAAAIITKIYAILNLITQAIIFLLFCDGIATFYGKKITISSAIKLIISLRSLKGATSLSVYFRAWFGMALGVLYIILLVYMIKQIISSFLTFKNVVFKHVSANTMCDDIFELGEYAGKAFFASTIFIVICSLVKNFNIPTNAYFVIILGFINYIATRIAISLINVWFKQYNYKALIKQFVYLTMFCISVLLLMYYSTENSVIKNFFDLIPELFFAKEAKAIISIVGSMLLSFTYAILAIIVLIIIHSANEYEDFKTLSTHHIAEKALGFSIAIFVIKLVLSFSNGIDINSTISIIKNWQDYVPTICSAFAVYWSSGFQITFERNEQTQQEYLETGKIDSKGVLKIGTNVTKISANIYQDCSNITKIIIPENVLEIEKDAFYGCGGVTGIYCEAISKPVGWDIDWNNGCYATVHWGIKASSSSTNEDSQ